MHIFYYFTCQMNKSVQIKHAAAVLEKTFHLVFHFVKAVFGCCWHWKERREKSLLFVFGSQVRLNTRDRDLSDFVF